MGRPGGDLTYKQSNECPICSGAMEEVISLPRFPLTEMYEPYTESFEDGRGLVDQSFLYCQPCSHGKLGTIVPPETLYAGDYRTKTSNSVGASHSVSSFYAFLRNFLDFANFETVIDVGANDSSLLDKFPEKRRVAVDPNASGSSELIREYIERADLTSFKRDKKLIVSSHTLEHIEKPEAFLEKVSSIFCHGDVLALQFPSLDYLVKDARIDQIHHQHIHYFSLRSTSLLLAKHGFEIVQYKFDDGHYGTLQLIARRGLEELKGDVVHEFDILEANGRFGYQTSGFAQSVSNLREPIGYGASLMLPVLGYYADLSPLVCVADQDESKWGQRYINLNKPITAPPDLRGRSVVITAFNTRMAVRAITKKLIEAGARDIIVPFHQL